VAIGKITRCIGVRGALKIFPFSSSLQRFLSLKEVYVGYESSKIEEQNICSVELRNDCVVIAFEGINDRTSAEKLLTKYIFIDEEQRIPLQNNEWFIDSIIGSDVFVEEKSIGKIIDVLKFPAQDVWVAKDTLGKETLIPAVLDILKKVDVHNKVVMISAIDGLL